MATKKKSAKKTVTATTKRTNRRDAKASTESPKELATAAPTRDGRLPPVGTVLQKRDRFGKVRCQCVIEEEGVRYDKTLFRSLSAAATAAAKDLDVKGNQNGYVFWGLSKPGRPGEDPIERLERTWVRYAETARALLAAGSADTRTEAPRAIGRHKGMDFAQPND